MISRGYEGAVISECIERGGRDNASNGSGFETVKAIFISSTMECGGPSLVNLWNGAPHKRLGQQYYCNVPLTLPDPI